MDSVTQTGAPSKKMLWAGRIISGLTVLMLLFSGGMKLLKPEAIVTEFTRLGYPDKVTVAIGIIEIVCAVLYAIPRTAILGAILLAAYLGGATATHLRIGDPFFMPPLLGVLIWLGLYLRDERLRALVPLRRP